MARNTTIVVTLWRIEPINNGSYGQPRFKLGTSEGIYTTMTGASFVYGIHNDNPIDQVVELTLTPAHRVRHMRILTDQEVRRRKRDAIIAHAKDVIGLDNRSDSVPRGQ